jgi:adenosylhomocysteine nucleosidase
VDVALICAMPMELRPLVRRGRLRRTRTGSESVYSGYANGRQVVAIATGMGTELAASRTERLLTAVEVGHVIVFGIAGAVNDATALGTIIRPRTVIDGATGTEYVPTQLTQTTPQDTQATPQHAQATARGTIWTTDELITDPGVVAALRARGVVALDMETAAIAAVCERRGLAWSAVRVISDRAADGVVTEEVFRLSKQDGSPNIAAVTRYFIRHPGHVRRMTRLAASARRATTIAADAAIAIVVGVA